MLVICLITAVGFLAAGLVSEKFGPARPWIR
jgi:hypothetical protein